MLFTCIQYADIALDAAQVRKQSFTIITTQEVV
jgi:hypothetical protein